MILTRPLSRAPFSRLLAAAAVLAVIGGGFVGASPAFATAAATSNFIATGHDLDWHCNQGNANECAYLKIAVDKVRNGSTLPVLSIDSGSMLTNALNNAGVTPVTVINPADAESFNALQFTSSSGAPLYSAIVVGSSDMIADISESDSATINARAADFKSYFNAGGGILALSSGGMDHYYDFVPVPVTGVDVSYPFTVTDDGAALGITSEMVNCCATHNSFETPDSPFVTLETDSSGASETIAVFGATISGGGFTTAPAVSITGDAEVFTKNTTPTISGTTSAVAGTAVTVTVAGQTLTTTVLDGGTWTVTPTVLVDGTYDVIASITDASTKTGTASQSLTVDTVAPAVSFDGGGSKLVNSSTPTITGTTDAAAETTVTVTVAGQTLTATVQVGGTWSVTAATVADGPNIVMASITDPAGNTGLASQSLTVDTIAPVVTVDGGATMNVHGSTPTITGTTDAAAGTPVTVTVDGQTLVTSVVDGRWTVTPTAVAAGANTVVASVPDPAGNIGTATQSLVAYVAPAFTEMSPTSSATVDSEYPSYTFVASGYPTSDFSITAGELPPGLELSSDGILSGTPTGTGGSYTFAVSATNAVDPDASTGSITIVVSAMPVIVTDAPNLNGTVGVDYASSSFTATGFPAPSFGFTGDLPAGLTIDPVSGFLSGIPTGAAATYTFAVTATNATGTATGVSHTISVVAAPPLVALNLGFALGSSVYGSLVMVNGSGLLIGSSLQIEVFSTPQTLASEVIGSNGMTTFTAVMPSDLPAGVHHLLVSGTSSTGEPITMTEWFTVDANGKVVALSSTGPTPTLAELAMTGGTVNIGAGVIAGLLAMLVGAALLLRRRFRRVS